MKGFLFTHTVASQGWHATLSFCLSVNKTWNRLHTPHESEPLILSHWIWEEEVQKWFVWITFQMQYICFKLNYCLSDVHMVFLQFWSGILGNWPYIVISCKCLETWWKGQQQWTHNGKAGAGTRSHSDREDNEHRMQKSHHGSNEYYFNQINLLVLFRFWFSTQTVDCLKLINVAEAIQNVNFTIKINITAENKKLQVFIYL